MPRNPPKKHWSFLKSGVPFWGSHNKDNNMLGSILGSPYFGNYHMFSWLLGLMLSNNPRPFSRHPMEMCSPSLVTKSVDTHAH